LIDQEVGCRNFFLVAAYPPANMIFLKERLHDGSCYLLGRFDAVAV
jgi:hypothetical protein